MSTKLLSRFALFVAAALACPMAVAADYPQRAVKFVVPFAAGGGSDLLARVFARKMQEEWGQPVVVENVTGSGGIVATQAVARAEPDGHTLLMGAIGTHSVNVSLYKDLRYDPERDFEPVSLLATSPAILVVSPSFPARTVPELVKYAKTHPGKVTYATAGVGTASHLVAEAFRQAAGIELVHVPYRGSAPAHVDLMSGQVTMMFDYPPAALPAIRADKFRGLGVTSRERFKGASDIPTLIESGLAGFEMEAWWAVYVPRGTPAQIVNRIQQTIAKAAAAPDVMQRADSLMLNLVASTPAELGRFQKAETQRWAKLIKEANIKAE